MQPPDDKTLEYPCEPARSTDGVCADLLPALAEVIDYDSVVVRETPRLKGAALTFRRGAKTLYRVSIIRRAGKCLVRLSGGDPANVVRAVMACRDHFDNWFGIEARDISPEEFDAS